MLVVGHALWGQEMKGRKGLGKEGIRLARGEESRVPVLPVVIYEFSRVSHHQ